MSLVGPRAYMPSELGKMGRTADSILVGKPGITGLWQTSGRNKLNFGQRLTIDDSYQRFRSVWLDIYILLRTVPTVLLGKGAN